MEFWKTNHSSHDIISFMTTEGNFLGKVAFSACGHQTLETFITFRYSQVEEETSGEILDCLPLFLLGCK